MDKISEYLLHARACNVTAAGTLNDDHRRLLQEMAATWMTLAREHARMTGNTLPDLPPIDLHRAPPGPPPAPPKKAKATTPTAPATAVSS